MSADDPQPHEPSEPESYVTMRPGGPFEGVVTVAAIAGGEGRSVVIVSWVRYGHARWDTVELPTFERALEVARSIADELAAGRPPYLPSE